MIDSAAVDAAAAAMLAREGRIDILINNAGIAQRDHRRGCRRRALAERARCDLNGSFWCARAFGRHMRAAGRGGIVNVGSISGFIVNRPQPQSYYNASKAAVHQLTKSLAAEWAGRSGGGALSA